MNLIENHAYKIIRYVTRKDSKIKIVEKFNLQKSPTYAKISKV